jgi:hypothetical protein
LQVQDSVLRFFEGVALKLPQGDTVPLTPFKGYFLISRMGSKGASPLQVQDSVLRSFEGVALKLPQGDTVPLTPFKGYFLISRMGSKGASPLQVQDSVLQRINHKHPIGLPHARRCPQTTSP